MFIVTDALLYILLFTVEQGFDKKKTLTRRMWRGLTHLWRPWPSGAGTLRRRRRRRSLTLSSPRSCSSQVYNYMIKRREEGEEITDIELTKKLLKSGT
jgi:hypothetical protein